MNGIEDMYYRLNNLPEYSDILLTKGQLVAIEQNCMDIWDMDDVELAINTSLINFGYTYNYSNANWMQRRRR